MGYAQDVQPWVRDQTYSSQSDRQWLSDWLFLVKFCLTLFYLQGRDTKEAQLSEKMCFSFFCFLPAALGITAHSDSDMAKKKTHTSGILICLTLAWLKANRNLIKTLEAQTAEQSHNSALHLSELTEPWQHTSVNLSLRWLGSLHKHTAWALRFPSSGS